MSNFYFSGKNINKTRKIQYNAVYNELRRSLNDDPTNSIFFYPFSYQNEKGCVCYSHVDGINNPLINPSQNTSRNVRISNILQNYTYYGQSQYANAPLGIAARVNYLGKTQGQPGGSGMPPKNRLV